MGRLRIRKLFSSITTLYSSDDIKEGAIGLRRNHNIKKPDSILEPTAIHNNLLVVTAASRLVKTPDYLRLSSAFKKIQKKEPHRKTVALFIDFADINAVPVVRGGLVKI